MVLEIMDLILIVVEMNVEIILSSLYRTTDGVVVITPLEHQTQNIHKSMIVNVIPLLMVKEVLGLTPFTPTTFTLQNSIFFGLITMVTITLLLIIVNNN